MTVEPPEYAIFEEALTLDPDQVAPFFDEQCRGDTPLRQKLDELWKAHRANLDTGTLDFETTQRLEKSLIGREIGRYTIIETIGQGAMGLVFRARRVGSDGEDYALKLLRMAQQTPAGTDRFENEIAALARLKHPHIAELIDHGVTEDGSPYLVMAFIDGTPLSELKLQTVSIEQRCEWICQVAEAVSHAHQHLLLHRDLKPGNILIAGDGRAVVTDFGLAKSLDADATRPLTAPGQVLGTPQYMAPEQVAADQEHTVATDVFGLGAVFYYMLTGTTPFGANSPRTYAAAVADSVPVPPRKHNGNIEPDLATVCLKCLKRNPDDRYRSVDEFRVDVQRFLAGEPVTARPVSSLERIMYWCRRHRLTAALSLSLAAVIAFTMVSQRHLLRKSEENYQAAQKYASEASATNLRLQQQADRFRRTIEKLTEQIKDIGSDPRQLETRRALLATLATHYDALLELEPVNADLVRSSAVAQFVYGSVVQQIMNYGPESSAVFQVAKDRFATFQKLAPDRADEVEFDLFHCERRLEQEVAAFERIEKLYKRNPGELIYRDAYANQSLNIARVSWSEGRYDEALAACAAGESAYQDLCAEFGRESIYLRHIATAKYQRGRTLLELGKAELAEAELSAAVTIQQEFMTRHDDDMSFFHECVLYCISAAEARIQCDNVDEGMRLLSKGSELAEVMRERFPQSQVSWKTSLGLQQRRLIAAHVSGLQGEPKAAHAAIVALLQHPDSKLDAVRTQNQLALVYSQPLREEDAEFAAVVAELEENYSADEIHWLIHFRRGRLREAQARLKSLRHADLRADYIEIIQTVLAGESAEPIVARIEGDESRHLWARFHRMTIRAEVDRAVAAFRRQ